MVYRKFRMSKNDLRIRPIYHMLRVGIEAHICIELTAYCVYKKLERVLYQEESTLSFKKADELTHNIYQITYTLPNSKHTKTRFFTMYEKQQELHDIVKNNF